MTFLTKILLTFDIFYFIVFYYGIYICNKFYGKDVDFFYVKADKGFIKTITFGMLIVLLQILYFPLMWLCKGHF
jgi:hypothetical protein